MVSTARTLTLFEIAMQIFRHQENFEEYSGTTGNHALEQGLLLMRFLVALGQDVEIVVKAKPRSRSARIAVCAA